ncbi:MAG: spore coat protein [bacterium]|nr:spore coat protein [bacterium]
MNLTAKETELLKDLKTQEQLCIEKYEKASQCAHKEELKGLFSSIANVERDHLKTINQIMGGSLPSTSSSASSSSGSDSTTYTALDYSDEQQKKDDAFLCQDMLTAEKHASSLYNTSVFEFSDSQARQVLNHIQTEEQQHGEKIYSYMSANAMYS